MRSQQKNPRPSTSLPGIDNEVETAVSPGQNVLTANATGVGPLGVTFTEADRARS